MTDIQRSAIGPIQAFAPDQNRCPHACSDINTNYHIILQKVIGIYIIQQNIFGIVIHKNRHVHLPAEIRRDIDMLKYSFSPAVTQVRCTDNRLFIICHRRRNANRYRIDFFDSILMDKIPDHFFQFFQRNLRPGNHIAVEDLACQQPAGILHSSNPQVCTSQVNSYNHTIQILSSLSAKDKTISISENRRHYCLFNPLFQDQVHTSPHHMIFIILRFRKLHPD